MSSPSAVQIDSDPNSLRAAALLTIKAKRKRPTRPVPVDNSAQLDYGQDDIATLSPSTDTASINPRLRPVKRVSADASPRQPSKTPEEIEDGQIREEGEISDSEASVIPPPESPNKRQKSVSDKEEPLPTQPPTIKAESPPPGPVFPIPLVTGALTMNGGQDIVMGDPSSSNAPLLEPEHVRPGLILNQAQYDKAKDLVLDLLGWGVPPEYFVDCGLSREIVFYVFTELQLRLPTNLDTKGIVPFLPPSSTPSTRTQLAPTAPPQIPQPRFDIYAQEQPSQTHNFADTSANGTPRESGSSTPTSATLQPGFTLHPPSPSLHDIEQQRRRELLARKAVQASRRIRRQESASSVQGSPGMSPQYQDVDMTPTPVMKETVDDFLKTIATPVVDADDTGQDSVQEPQRSSSVSSMDVDPPPSAALPDYRSPMSAYSSVSDLATPIISTNGMPTPTTATFPPSATPLSSTFSELSTTSTRRIPKRPVAADFVDFDSAPTPPLERSNGNGLRRGHSFSSNRSSFATVSGMKRCIIELSDSEEDDNTVVEVVNTTEGGSSVVRYRSSADSLLSKVLPPSATASVSSLRMSQSGTMSPASLEEKEQEIKRMREMIARKEQNRQLKLSTLSRSNSIVPLSNSDSLASNPAPPESGSGHQVQPRAQESLLPAQSPKQVTSDDDGKPGPISPTSSTGSSIDLNGATAKSKSGATPTIDEPPDAKAIDGEDSGDPTKSATWQAGTDSKPEALASTSARTLDADEETEYGSYSKYVSPLDGIPFLRARTLQASSENGSVSSSSHSSSASCSSASASSIAVTVPDLRPFKVILHADPMKHLCVYETSGGECRDASCQDLHVEPRIPDNPGVRAYSDQELAEYVYGTIIAESRMRTRHALTVKMIHEALQRQGPGKTMEERVAQALSEAISSQRSID